MYQRICFLFGTPSKTRNTPNKESALFGLVFEQRILIFFASNKGKKSASDSDLEARMDVEQEHNASAVRCLNMMGFQASLILEQSETSRRDLWRVSPCPLRVMC